MYINTYSGRVEDVRDLVDSGDIDNLTQRYTLDGSEVLAVRYGQRGGGGGGRGGGDK